MFYFSFDENYQSASVGNPLQTHSRRIVALAVILLLLVINFYTYICCDKFNYRTKQNVTNIQRRVRSFVFSLVTGARARALNRTVDHAS